MVCCAPLKWLHNNYVSTVSSKPLNNYPFQHPLPNKLITWMPLIELLCLSTFFLFWHTNFEMSSWATAQIKKQRI